MADDDLLIQEINQEIRSERLRSFGRRFGTWIVGLSLGLLLATVGYEIYSSQQLTQREEATAYLMDATRLINEKQYDTAASRLSERESHSKEMQGLLLLQQARALTAAGKKDEAAAIYQRLENSQDPITRQFAALRQKNYTQVTQPPFNRLAREMEAWNLYQQGKLAEAKQALDALAMDTSTPPAIRNRVELLRQQLAVKAGS